jgi:hypothetical protein
MDPSSIVLCLAFRCVLLRGQSESPPRKRSTHDNDSEHLPRDPFSQVFGSTLLEDLQSDIFSASAEVQSVKQHLDAAHAAAAHPQARAAVTTVTSQLLGTPFESANSSGESDELSCPEGFPISAFGASGAVCVPAPFWSAHAISVLHRAAGSGPGLLRPISVTPTHTQSETPPPALPPSVLPAASDRASPSLTSSSSPVPPAPAVTPSAPPQTLPAIASPQPVAAPEAPPPTEEGNHSGASDRDTRLSTNVVEVSALQATTLLETRASDETAISNESEVVLSTMGANHTKLNDSINVVGSDVVALGDTVSGDTSRVASVSAEALQESDPELVDIARYLDTSLETLQALLVIAATSSPVPGPADTDGTTASDNTASQASSGSDAVSTHDEAEALVPSSWSPPLPSPVAAPPQQGQQQLQQQQQQQQPGTVFKQLTNKLKLLEIDQSVVSSYLKDLRTSYATSMAAMEVAVEGVRASSAAGFNSTQATLSALVHAVYEMREALALLYRRHVAMLRVEAGQGACAAEEDASGDDFADSNAESSDVNDDVDSGAKSGANADDRGHSKDVPTPPAHVERTRHRRRSPLYEGELEVVEEMRQAIRAVDGVPRRDEVASTGHAWKEAEEIEGAPLRTASDSMASFFDRTRRWLVVRLAAYTSSSVTESRRLQPPQAFPTPTTCAESFPGKGALAASETMPSRPGQSSTAQSPELEAAHFEALASRIAVLEYQVQATMRLATVAAAVAFASFTAVFVTACNCRQRVHHRSL